MTVKGFIGERSQLYAQILDEFPLARAKEVKVNLGILNPKRGEKILEVGAGSGLYSRPIADLIGPTGELVASDPSGDQLNYILSFHKPNIRIVQKGADRLDEEPDLLMESESFDAVWSLGAFHHCLDKSRAFKNFSHLLKKGGRVMICDVFSGSLLADYFDAEVARFSVSGHEVAFLTKNFSRSLCSLFGFAEPKFHDLDHIWYFDSREDLGLFMYKIHGMSKSTPTQCLQMVEEMMEVEQVNGQWVLHVPLTILETYKL